MNVADSQVDQESRFQAEAGRVFKHVRKIDDLAKKNALSFAAFDELFSGTSPAEGTELGYKVAKTLCYFPNSISILATHFQPLTQLEADTNGRYINYRVPVVMNGRGTVSVVNNKVQRTFTLEPGISNQHIAREVFTERGIDQDLLHRILDDGKESETTTASNATLAATASSSSSLTSLSTSSAQTTHLPRQ
jgi:DNA mismatch repair ATPase MutS